MTLDEAEDAIRRAKIEHLAFYTDFGKTLVLAKSGNESSVALTPVEVEKVLAAGGEVIATHNHPSGFVLSGDDVRLTIGLNLKEMRATTPSGEAWVLQRPDEGWPGHLAGAEDALLHQLQHTYNRAAAEARARMDEHITSAGGKPGDTTHPAFTTELFNAFYNEAVQGAVAKSLRAYGADTTIERRSASQDPTRFASQRDPARLGPNQGGNLPPGGEGLGTPGGGGPRGPRVVGTNVVPQEALDYFKAKGLRPGFSYLDVWREEHDHSFTVAKLMEKNLLADVRASVQSALEEGTPFRQWAEEIKPTFDKSGWSTYGTEHDTPRRLKTIYDTNMRVARAVGQWQRVERTKIALPYLKYELGPSENHRDEHVEWAEAPTILPVDDPWWEEHYPPNGFGCKCFVRQISRDEAASLGGVTDAPEVEYVEWVNPKTGEHIQVPKGVDPGWDRNPGQERFAEGV